MNEWNFLLDIIKQNLVAGLIFAIWYFQYRDNSKNTRELIAELKENNRITAEKFDRSIDKISDSLNQHQVRLASIEAKIDSHQELSHG